MNRRNFILGLGTAATLSGAASVTGASISGSADAGANFQVIAENQLNVRRNQGLTTAANGEIDNSTYETYVNTSENYVNEAGSSEGTINETIGSGVEDVNGPRLTVNDQEDGSLSMALATQNDADIENNVNDTVGTYNSTYSDDYTGPDTAAPPLEIVNNGGADQTVSVRYGYGDDVDGSNPLTYGDVNQLFTFRVNEGTDSGTDGGKVSPDPTEDNLQNGDDANNFVTLNSGETATVDLSLNFSSDIVNAISDAAGGSSYDFANDGLSSVDLLKTVTFGVSNQ